MPTRTTWFALFLGALLAASLLAVPSGTATRGSTPPLPPPHGCGAPVPPGVPPPAPSVTIGASPNPGDADANISFCATVTGVSGSYTVNWSFGDGNFSHLLDPVHVYATAANYTATMTLNSTDYNQTSTEYVYVNSRLQAAATFSPSAPTTSTVITFNDTVSGGTPPYVTFWNFTDGHSALGSSATHTFGSAGTHTVKVETNDTGGGHVVQFLQVTVTSPPPPFLGGGTGILIGTTIAAVAVAIGGFGYLQWEKKRRTKLPTPVPPPAPPPPAP